MRIEYLNAEDSAFVKALLLHQDKDILAFNKPSGLAVQGGSGVHKSLEYFLQAFTKSNGKRPHLVHRLDINTSGVIVVARNKPAAAALSKAFAERDAHKTYLAIVSGGAPEPANGEIALRLKKIQRNGQDVMKVVEEGGQDAHSLYKTLSATEKAAFLELHPKTGRMHQLRVHLAAIGRPILGDKKYGGAQAISGVKAPRLALHAARLDIPHPEGGRIVLEAPPPAEFEQVLRSLSLEPTAPPMGATETQTSNS
jgi:tRNA pseudouridine32 synthase/23S rRNA pseudouridine746 synthase